MGRKRRGMIGLGAAALAAAVLAGGIWTTHRPATAAEFELAMVIKETTNPYYNATLKGAHTESR